MKKFPVVIVLFLGIAAVVSSFSEIETITYRTVTFWVPFGVGAWAFRTLHTAGEQPA